MLDIKNDLPCCNLDDGLGGVILGKNGLNFVEETVYFSYVVTYGLLYSAKVLDAGQVDYFSMNVKLFISYFA